MDYGTGNFLSVERACDVVGLRTVVTSDAADVRAADAVILPGVGSFSCAMEALHEHGLVEPLRYAAESGKPLVGICLGLQLLMTESSEFGRHRGLGILEGAVVRFQNLHQGPRTLKVPHTGWNRVFRNPTDVLGAGDAPLSDPWAGSLMAGIQNNTPMYFAHSFFAKPRDPGTVLSFTHYGGQMFCSSIQHGNIFACQFHPERSGPTGLQVYRNLAAALRRPGIPKEETRAFTATSAAL